MSRITWRARKTDASGRTQARLIFLWRLIPGQTLAYRGWDDEYVVYNDLSGDTHLFGVDAMQLLLHLRAGPADEEALARALEVLPDERAGLAVMLTELRAMSLIERI
jgi:PqqD family protein of HPr-rel-A system